MRGKWVLVGAALLGAACVGEESVPTGGGGVVAGPAEGESFDQGAGGARGVSTAPLDLPAVGPTVIKTADLTVEVERDGLGEAMDRATDVAGRYGGFVVSSATGGDGSRRGSLTVRIPSESFERAVVDLGGLGEVRHRRVAGRDVGPEFVDLEGRLRNQEAQQAVLLRLFDDAGTVVDTIRIQRELSDVQLQIEQIEGRLRFLRDQTEMGTITVAISEEGTAAPGAFDRALDRAVDGFLSVIAAMVVMVGYALPVALIALVVMVAYRRLRPGTAGAGS